MDEKTMAEVMAECSRLRDDLAAEKRRADVAESDLKREREVRLQEREQGRARLDEASKVLRRVEAERDTLQNTCDGLSAERVGYLRQNQALAAENIKLGKQLGDARGWNALAGMAAVGVVGGKLLSGRRR